MKVSTHFDIREFVPELIFNSYGANSVWFISPAIINLAEYIRGYFGEAVIINNWHTGGSFQNRGFRMPDTTVGAKLSQHKFGRAIDINVHGYSSDEIAKAIIDNQSKFIENGLTTIEDPASTPTWTHLDVRFVQGTGLLIVKP